MQMVKSQTHIAAETNKKSNPISTLEFKKKIWRSFEKKKQKNITHSPLEILPKNAFWSYQSFLVTALLYIVLRAKTYHKAFYRTYTSQPSDPDAKYLLAKSGHAQKANFEILGLKVTQLSWLLLFAFSPLSFSTFLASFFFFCWVFHRLHFGGKDF